MDIARALTFFTEEDRWIEKTTIGTLVLLVSSLLSVVLVGVVGFFILTGYGVRLMRNVQQKTRPVLPEWDQWGEDLTRGFKLFLVMLLWSLPIIVAVIPTVFGAMLADSGGGGEIIGGILLLCGSCVTILYALFLMLIQPGITIAFARNEQISDAFQFTAIWQWTRDQIGNVLMVAIVYVVGSLIISTVAGIVGMILCGIGLLITIPLGVVISTYFQYHLYGQLDPGALGGGSFSRRSYADDSDFTPSSPATPASSVVVTDPTVRRQPDDIYTPPVPPVNQPPTSPAPEARDLGNDERPDSPAL